MFEEAPEQVTVHRRAPHVTCVAWQVDWFEHCTSQEAAVGHEIVASWHAEAPPHSTRHWSSGGQVIAMPWQALVAVQSMMQALPTQPPVHAAGHGPV